MQMGRCCRLTFILTLAMCCLVVYLYLYYAILKNQYISDVYYRVRGDRNTTSNKSVYTNASPSYETGIFYTNESPVRKLSTLSTYDPPLSVTIQRKSNSWSRSVQNVVNSWKRPLLTLFTTWTENTDKYYLHNITSFNWLSLVPFIVPVLFTNERFLTIKLSRMGWIVLPVRETAAHGVPVLKYMYLDAIRAIDSEYYAFANSDILFTDNLVETLLAIHQNDSMFQTHTLIIGRRTNVNNVTEIEGSSWKEIESTSNKRGVLFDVYAEDYFITSALYPWSNIPNIVIGRVAYDNWLVLNARQMKYRVIDATETILAMHQTTKAGNFEGSKHPDTRYNINLLETLLKKVPYTAGYTSCAELITRNESGKIVIFTRSQRETYCNF